MFNNFSDTIFLKKGNELEIKLKALENLLNKHPNNEKLKQDYYLCKKGLKGEQEIYYQLSNANIGMFVLHDINIYVDGLSAQIDYIIITPAYRYFIECKNYSGNVTVDSTGQFTIHTKHGKMACESPLEQATRHINICKKIWSNRHPIYSKLNSEEFEKYNKPLVVMSNLESILNLKYAKKEVKNKVIRADNLVAYLQHDLEEYKKTGQPLLSQKQMRENAEGILKYYNRYKADKNYSLDYDFSEDNIIVNQEISKENTNIDLIKSKLLEYRLTTSKEKNIPAYYVFNNNELDDLLKYLPKSVDELYNLKILNPIRIKCHGQEIVDIINIHP